MSEFTLKQAHLDLLQRAYVGWDDCETGAPAIDCKRPYGNSDVAGDVAKILGVDLKEDDDGYRDEALVDEMLVVHYETEIALQILLLAAGRVPALGLYRKTGPYDDRSWKYVGPVEETK